MPNKKVTLTAAVSKAIFNVDFIFLVYTCKSAVQSAVKKMSAGGKRVDYCFLG